MCHISKKANYNFRQSKKLAMVHIYFGEDSMYPKIRKELYGFVDLIGMLNI